MGITNSFEVIYRYQILLNYVFFHRNMCGQLNSWILVRVHFTTFFMSESISVYFSNVILINYLLIKFFFVQNLRVCAKEEEASCFNTSCWTVCSSLSNSNHWTGPTEPATQLWWQSRKHFIFNVYKIIESQLKNINLTW